jgi:sodium/hydrogen antiporter
MDAVNAQSLAMTMALVGLVIVVAALLSGFIERSGLPQVAVFLALGAMLGPSGLGLLAVGLNSPLLRVVATLSLALVLFTDAVSLNIREARQHSGLALLVLGPGTILSAGLIALAAWALLGLSPAGAVILGAALASTDPVLLRGLLNRRDLSATVRQALRLESGLNDVVLLPVVLVAMAFLGQGAADHAITNAAGWARLGIELFLLGPGAGVMVGLVAVATLDLVRRRIGVRRDYESLYSLGVAFTAFAAAEAVHGSGFLAVFAAGLTIAALDVELCDCFLDYGAATAEMALLFTFVLFGSSLIWSGFAVLSGAALLFIVLTILIRPLTFLLSFVRTRMPSRDRLLIAWFGPRGLSSLLLILLPVFDRLPGSTRLFEYCCLVVLTSVLLHGGSLMFLGKRPRHQPTTESGEAGAVPATESPAPQAAPVVIRVEDVKPAGVDGAGGAGSDVSAVQNAERITIAEMQALQKSGAPLVVLDARTERSYGDSNLNPVGAERMVPQHVVEQARERGLPKEAWLAIFCA